MMEDIRVSSKQASGFIYTSKDNTDIDIGKLALFNFNVSANQWDYVKNVNQWDWYLFKTKKDFRVEEKTNADGYYEYIILSRMSHSKMILLAQSREIIRFLFSNGINRSFGYNLQPVEFEIQILVKDFLLNTEDNGGYALCQVYASVEELKGAAESISFYGQDLASSTLFNMCVEKQNIECYAAGLKTLEHPRKEVLRVNNSGGISFLNASKEGLVSGVQALNFLIMHGYSNSDGIAIK